MATSSSEPSEVEFQIKNTARIISLNRGSKLNALNTSMCKEITPRLVEYAKSNSNNLIIIKSNSDKSFCSGGDVIQCAKNNLSGNPQSSIEFFQSEYSLNYLLSVYNKPIVSIVNGIVMGGGVGLSVHTPFRIVCESTRFAMPETNIGFFSDVGTSFWLPKLDGNLGYYLSLTGDELTGLDTFIAGFGTHYIPSSRFDHLIERLSLLEMAQLSTDKKGYLFGDKSQFYAIVNEAIEEFSEQIPKHHKFKFDASQLKTIEECFNPKKCPTVEEVIESLLKDGSEFALKTVKNLQTKSPISLNLCWKLLIQNSQDTIQNSLSTELMTAAKMMVSYKPNDFNEYISKNLINKKSTNPEDKIPKPYYETLSKIPATLVDNLTNMDIYNPDIKRSLNSDYSLYPYSMGLPTQSEVEQFVKGTTAEAEAEAEGESEGEREVSYATFKGTLKYFDDKYRSKNGVYYKVVNILKRKTQLSSYGNETLEWID
ncbi:hypothetical protein CANARDRAFT_202552 [[Candida] arabinofermentans NRRL YB-2248]|uniref:3-hydroxyisobutyryl-CoA hydrolase n=1 Tax=[Candida] arabinofermentans NRRL YB-2248 TaxID=983967 RepID=A0A1E4SW14_9ASCO|nr:hypothetical protein CANARDRAFT_202552 [[Candida] arabinofermentans NRRL YB-2248]